MNGMYEELIEKLRKNNRMSGWTHIDRLMDDAIKAIEALQQENKQLRAQLDEWKYEVKCHMDEVIAREKQIEQLRVLKKAREAIQRAKENFEPYGEYEYDVRYDLEEALAEIDKAIGGKEDGK